MSWVSYSLVQSTQSSEIQFEDLVTFESVYGVAVSQGGLRTVESTALVFTGFPITGTVYNLRLELSVNRLARIQDRVIQLWIDSKPWGSNLANLAAENRSIYSWNNLNLQWRTDYGVIIDLQPHTQYPSSNTVQIRSVRLETF